MKKVFALLIVLIIFCTSCREPYIPPVESLQNQLLVVEANLDPNGPTTVRLSRTTKLTDTTIFKAENNATVTVEGNDNTIRNLVFNGSGNYFSSNLNLATGGEYRVRIKSLGKEYLSDYVSSITNPPLDSISWERNNDGVQIYVNTNNSSNTVKYFRWDYIETWEIHSYLYSDVIYQNGAIRPRNFPAENVSVCWKNSPSAGILLANSVQLKTGVISKMPVVFIPHADEKLYVRYSINARQYALNKEAYNFFEILKKNTEDIGSFFGPQPAEIKGNIHCLTTPDEPVIGYVTASGVTEKRIFISAVQVPQWPNNVFCNETRVPRNQDSIKVAIQGGLIPASFLGDPPNQYVFGTPFCVDCTTRDASNKKPIFW